MMRAGARVAVSAHYFDRKNDNSWSFAYFGEKCFGTIISVITTKNLAKVKWDIDEKITNVKISDLEYVSENIGK